MQKETLPLSLNLGCITSFYTSFMTSKSPWGFPWLTPVIFDPALIYLDIYFINVVNSIAEKGGAEVSMEWGLFSLSQ